MPFLAYPTLSPIKESAYQVLLSLGLPAAWGWTHSLVFCPMSPPSISIATIISRPWEYNKVCFFFFSWASSVSSVAKLDWPSYKRIKNTQVPSNFKIPCGSPFFPVGLTLYPWSHPSFFIKGSTWVYVYRWVVLSVCFLPVEFWGSDNLIVFFTFFCPNLQSFCWYKILKNLTTLWCLPSEAIPDF